MTVSKLSQKHEQEHNLPKPQSWEVLGKDYNTLVDKISEVIDHLGADDTDFTTLTETVTQLGETVTQLGEDLVTAQGEIAALPAELMIEITQDTTSTTSGLLVEGEMYVIEALIAGDDFTNVGYVEEGTAFEATGTTPTAWTESTVVVKVTESEPVLTVIKNDIGVITWGRTGVGSYAGIKTDAFPAGYSFIHQKVIIPAADSTGRVKVSFSSDDAIVINTYSDAGVTLADGILDATPIHVTVYPQPAE